MNNLYGLIQEIEYSFHDLIKVFDVLEFFRPKMILKYNLNLVKFFSEIKSRNLRLASPNNILLFHFILQL